MLNGTLAPGGVNPALAALEQGTLGVGFSGSGFLLFYFFGVLSALQDLGIVKPSTPLAGASGGAIATISSCAGVPPARSLEDLIRTSEGCRRQQECYHTLDRELRTQLNGTLPADAAARCSGRGFVAVTRVVPGSPDPPAVLGGFTSRQDVIDATAASSYLPYWSAPEPFTEVRSFRAYDGGFSDPLPCPPPSANVTYCIKVQAQPYGTPASGATQQALSQFTALTRAAGGNATQGAPAPEIDRQITPPPADVDIAPGKPGLGPLTFSPAAWESFALLQAPNAAVAREVYDVGSRDARAWARGAGLADASAAGRRGRREL